MKMKSSALILAVCFVFCRALPNAANQAADVFFLLDSSSSVWLADFKKQLDFMANMVDSLDVISGQTRIGVATFSSEYYPQVELNTPLNVDALKDKIRRIPYRCGDAYTDVALRDMREKSFHNDKTRGGVVKIGVLITDGCSQFQRPKTAKEAAETKANNITLLVIGVGNKLCPSELTEMASKPSYFLRVTGFDSLQTIQGNLTDLIHNAKLTDSSLDRSECHFKEKVDVMFVFDPASIGTQRVMKVNEFICDVVGKFDMTSGTIRAGVLSKSTIDNDVQLDQHPNLNSLIKDLTSRSKFFPELSKLIRELRQHSFTSPAGGRVGAKKRAVIFLTEELSKSDRVRSEIDRARYWDIDIYIIHMGSLGDQTITDDKQDWKNRFLHVDNFEKLLNKIDEFVKLFCDG